MAFSRSPEEPAVRKGIHRSIPRVGTLHEVRHENPLDQAEKLESQQRPPVLPEGRSLSTPKASPERFTKRFGAQTSESRKAAAKAKKQPATAKA